MIQAFRRRASAEVSRTFRLCGLDPAGHYNVTNFNAEGSTTISGRELMENGVTVEIADAPRSAIIMYNGVRSVLLRKVAHRRTSFEGVKRRFPDRWAAAPQYAGQWIASNK